MRSKAKWQEAIDRLIWEDSNIIPTSKPSTKSKTTKSKWFKCKSSSIDTDSQLTREWKKIATKLRPKGRNTPVIVAHKYRIYPDKETRILYNNVFGVHRFLRNKAVVLVESWMKHSKIVNSIELDGYEHTEGDENDKTPLLPPKSFLRKLLIKKNARINEEYPWLKKYFFDLKDEAIRQLIKDYIAGFERAKIDHKSFKMRMRSRKDDLKSCSFTIEKKHWYESDFWNSLLPKDYACRDLRYNKYCKNPSKEIQTLIDQGYYPDGPDKLPKKLQHAAKIQRIDGKYYVIINLKLKEQKVSNDNLFVVDPGYRTCFTGINFRDNILEEICTTNTCKITRTLRKASHTQGLITKATKKRTRHHLKRKHRKRLDRAKNLVDDLQKSTSKYMCDNYSTILIPKLNFHQLVGLTKERKEKAQRVSHCSFVDRLKIKSKQYRNCKVIEVTEECTSKTCSRCGYYFRNLGANKVYDCAKCGNIMDRDMNAVYNILMKRICEQAEELKQQICF